MNLLHFYLLLMNSLQFLLFKNWILCIFYPLRVNSWQFLSTRVNFFQFSLFKGEFFAIFTLQAWILWIFSPFKGNFFHFCSFRDEFWQFSPLRVNSLQFFLFKVNSLQFLPFKVEFFAIFTLQGWNFCKFYLFEIFLGWKGQKITLVMVNFLKFWFFHSLRLNFLHFFILKGWILSNFHPSRVNYLHFSPFKDEFFAIFILKGDFFLIFTL